MGQGRPRSPPSSTKLMGHHVIPRPSPCSAGRNTEAALNHQPGTPSTVLDAEADEAIPNPHISVDEPTLDEVVRAISKLRNGRAASPDGIPPELLKCAIDPV